MLIQHRYKIVTPFLVRNGVILKKTKWKRVGHSEMPTDIRCYKPSKRKWDYVDYSGRTYYGSMKICEITHELERAGKLIYIGVKKYE